MTQKFYTHVANASNKTIHVQVSEKLMRTSSEENLEIKVGPVGGGGGYKYTDEHDGRPGLVAIGSGNYFRFQVQDPIIIVYTDDDECISEGANPGSDQSVIITKELTLVNTKWGEKWVDHDSINHLARMNDSDSDN